MKYSELKESPVNNQIPEVINMALVSMMANDNTEVSPEELSSVLSSKYNINISTSTLLSIVEDLDFVISADEQNIVLGDPNSQSASEGTGGEEVDEFEKLDKSPSSTPGVDTWTTT